MSEILKTLGQKAKEALGFRDLTKLTRELTAHLEEEELANRILMTLNGVDARTNLIEEEKIKNELFVKRVVEEWNTDRTNRNQQLRLREKVVPNLATKKTTVLIEITLLMQPRFIDYVICSNMVEFFEFGMGIEYYDKYDRPEVNLSVEEAKESMYSKTFTSITQYGLRGLINSCQQKVKDEQDLRDRTEARQHVEYIRNLKIKDTEERLQENKTRDAEFLRSQRLLHRIVNTAAPTQVRHEITPNVIIVPYHHDGDQRLRELRTKQMLLTPQEVERLQFEELQEKRRKIQEENRRKLARQRGYSNRELDWF